MEKAVERQLDECCRAPGMKGAICVDRNGLLLAVRGCMSPSAAGPVSSLANVASSLHPRCSNGPVIVVESQHGKILIRQDHEITTAVFKT